MRKNQIIYFLNAVYYGIWTINMKFGDFIGRIVEAILSPVPKYFFSKSYKEKYYKRLPTEREKTEKFLRRTRQTLWRAVQMLTQKLCCQTIHDCPKVVPLHYESE